jgi:hypothetical protein
MHKTLKNVFYSNIGTYLFINWIFFTFEKVKIRKNIINLILKINNALIFWLELIQKIETI